MKNTSISELVTHGHINLSLTPDVVESVGTTMESWKAFCRLSEERRQQFGYDQNGGMGVGYELKKVKGTSLDLKEDFHYTFGMREVLAQSAANAGLEASRIVADSNKTLQVLAPIIMDFAQVLETDLNIPGLAREVADSQDQWFLRLLHYFGDRQHGEETATSHADKSGFTLHLYESGPGLQFLDFDMKWQDVHVEPGTSFVIPGMRLQYRSEGKLKALFHRVVATEETALTGRYSMVCFVHLKNTPQYDKAKQGRLQEFAPGFNYSMLNSEFKKLFK